MDTGLTNRTALITGGGTGIGAAIAQGMAAEGANVIVNYSRSEQDAQNTVAQITDAGGQAIAIRCDVSQSSQVRSMFEQARGHFGQVDILVNNAGRVFSRQPTADLPEDMWDQTIDVNLKGVFLCSQAAIAQMPDKIGRIINITSVTAFSGVGSSSYGAAKGGVNALTRCMALELGSRGITVNGIAPGIVDTRIHRLGTPPDRYAQLLEKIPLGRDGKVDDVVGIALLLASDAGSYISGDIIHVNGAMLMH